VNRTYNALSPRNAYQEHQSQPPIADPWADLPDEVAAPDPWGDLPDEIKPPADFANDLVLPEKEKSPYSPTYENVPWLKPTDPFKPKSYDAFGTNLGNEVPTEPSISQNMYGDSSFNYGNKPSKFEDIHSTNPDDYEQSDPGFSLQTLKDQFTWPNAVRMGISTAGDIAGAATGGLLYYPISAAAGGLGEFTGQVMEGKSPWDVNYKAVGTEAFLNPLTIGPSIPKAGAGLRGALKFIGGAAEAGGKNALVGINPRKWANEGFFDKQGKFNYAGLDETAGQVGVGTLMGGATGALMHGSTSAYRAGRAGPKSPLFTGDIPGGAKSVDPNYVPPSGPRPSAPDFDDTATYTYNGPESNQLPPGPKGADPVITFDHPDMASIQHWRDQGYVMVDRDAKGRFRMARADAADQYIAPIPENQDINLQYEAPKTGDPNLQGGVGDPELAGSTPYGEAPQREVLEGEILPAPTEPVTPPVVEQPPIVGETRTIETALDRRIKQFAHLEGNVRFINQLEDFLGRPPTDEDINAPGPFTGADPRSDFFQSRQRMMDQTAASERERQNRPFNQEEADKRETWERQNHNLAVYEGRTDPVIKASYDKMKAVKDDYSKWFSQQEEQLPEGELFKPPPEVEEAYKAQIERMEDEHQAVINSRGGFEQAPPADIQGEVVPPSNRVTPTVQLPPGFTPPPVQSPLVLDMKARMKYLDGRKAPDASYKALASKFDASPLRPGETWRNRLKAGIAGTIASPSEQIDSTLSALGVEGPRQPAHNQGDPAWEESTDDALRNGPVGIVQGLREQNTLGNVAEPKMGPMEPFTQGDLGLNQRTVKRMERAMRDSVPTAPDMEPVPDTSEQYPLPLAHDIDGLKKHGPGAMVPDENPPEVPIPPMARVEAAVTDISELDIPYDTPMTDATKVIIRSAMDKINETKTIKETLAIQNQMDDDTDLAVAQGDRDSAEIYSALAHYAAQRTVKMSDESIAKLNLDQDVTNRLDNDQKVLFRSAMDKMDAASTPEEALDDYNKMISMADNLRTSHPRLSHVARRLANYAAVKHNELEHIFRGVSTDFTPRMSIAKSGEQQDLPEMGLSGLRSDIPGKEVDWSDFPTEGQEPLPLSHDITTEKKFGPGAMVEGEGSSMDLWNQLREKLGRQPTGEEYLAELYKEDMSKAPRTLEGRRERAKAIERTMRDLLPVADTSKQTAFILSSGTRLGKPTQLIHAQALRDIGLKHDEVLKTGVIRVNGSSGETRGPITERQARELINVRIQRKDVIGYMDVVLPDGETVGKPYDERMTPAALTSWVNSHFPNEGMIRGEQQVLPGFRLDDIRRKDIADPKVEIFENFDQLRLPFDHPIVERFRDRMKQTNDYKMTRFISPDGERYTFGVGLMHHEGARSIGVDLQHAQEAGMMRFRDGAADIGAPITIAQARHLIDARADLRNPSIPVDVRLPDHSIESNEFSHRAKASTIYNWVNNLFKKAVDTARAFEEGWNEKGDGGTTAGALFGGMPFGRAARGIRNAARNAGWGQGGVNPASRTNPPVPPPGPPPAYSTVEEAMQVPRHAMTAGDVSFLKRQAAGMITQPEYWKAVLEIPRSARQAGFDAIDQRNRQSIIYQNPLGAPTRAHPNGAPLPSLADDMGIQLYSLASGPQIGPRAQAVASRWLEELPGPLGKLYRVSSRMHTTFLNTVKTEVAEKTARYLVAMSGNAVQRITQQGGGTTTIRPGLMKQEVTAQEAFELNPFANPILAREIGDWINTATGSAPLKTHWLPHKNREWDLTQHAAALNRTLFASGLAASRVRMLNPSTYVMASPFVRKQYMRSALGQAAAWFTSMFVNKMAADALGIDNEISFNVTSSDFGKNRMGNVRLDPGQGLLQFLVLYGRHWYSGHTTASSDEFRRFGEEYRGETHLSNVTRFLTNKTEPFMKFALDLASADKNNPFHVGDRLIQLAVPLFFQDVVEIAKEDPWLLIPLGMQAAIGDGTQIYERNESRAKFIPTDYDYVYEGNEGLQKIMPWNWFEKDPNQLPEPYKGKWR